MNPNKVVQVKFLSDSLLYLFIYYLLSKIVAKALSIKIVFQVARREGNAEVSILPFQLALLKYNLNTIKFSPKF